jgi:uncharacterized protein with FMN-binding domain
MSYIKHDKKRDYAYYVRKYLLTAFVVASFAGYVIHEQDAGSSAGGAIAPVQTSVTANQQVPVATIYPTAVTDNQAQIAAPTDAPQPTVAAASGATDSQSQIGPPAPTVAPTTDAPPAAVAPTNPPPTDVPPTPVPPAVVVKSGYKDGQFTGNVADAYYGPVQVKVVIQNGKITDVQIVDYPHDRRRSVDINTQAVPWLQSEAMQAQSAQVDIISGATLTSQAFIESMQTALDNAKS